MGTVGFARRTKMGTFGCARRTKMGTFGCAGRTKMVTVGRARRTKMANGNTRRVISQGVGQFGWKVGITLRLCKNARGSGQMKNHQLIVWFDVQGLGSG